jgi:hypothetical protein
MQADDFELRRLYFRPRSGTYTSYVATERATSVEYLLTIYDLAAFAFANDLLTGRLLFIYQNYRLFHCRAVFFDVPIISPDSIKATNIPSFLRYFYVVEPLSRCLCDCADAADFRWLFAPLASLIATLHAHRFVYGFLSPFTIVVEDDQRVSLRVPPLMPLVPPKAAIAPPFRLKRPHYRSIGEIQNYLPPESELAPAWDRWSFGVLLCGLLAVGGGEIFAAGAPRDGGAWRRALERVSLPPVVGAFLKVEPCERLALRDFDAAELPPP